MNIKIFVISLTAGILLVSGGYLLSLNFRAAPESVFCTQDAKQCPDGSFVGRTGPKCEFSACPESPSSGLGAILDSSDWKTYRNEKYGFEVKYPENFTSIENSQYYEFGIELENTVDRGISVYIDSLPRDFDIYIADRLKESEVSSRENLGDIVVSGVVGILGKQCDDGGCDYIIFLPHNKRIYEIVINEAIGPYKQILSTFKFIDVKPVTTGGTGLIKGRVLLGPICPVERIPPDPNCAPKGYQTILKVSNNSGFGVVKEIKSDADGYFQIQLPPGVYEFSASGGSVFPRCESQTIQVKAGVTTELTIYCDTGIR